VEIVEEVGLRVLVGASGSRDGEEFGSFFGVMPKKFRMSTLPFAGFLADMQGSIEEKHMWSKRNGRKWLVVRSIGGMCRDASTCKR
jgi:hypothetical protein